MKVGMRKQGGGLDPQTQQDVFFAMKDIAGQKAGEEASKAEAEGRPADPQAGNMAYAFQASYDNMLEAEDHKARRLLSKGQFDGGT